MYTPGLPPKTCPGCNTEFIPARSNQTRCKKDCKLKRQRPPESRKPSRLYDKRTTVERNKIRDAKRNDVETYPTKFIALDGEAVWTGEPFASEFVYSLLSIGEESLYNDGSKPLPLLDIFEFLYSHFLREKQRAGKYDRIAYVGFFLGFDFTHWFRQLPEERARMLFTLEGIAKRQRTENPALGPFPVEWQGWEFDLLGFKRLKLRPRNGGSWLYVCDAGPFFQTSLLNAAVPSKWQPGTISQSDYDLILEGKSLRGIAGLDSKMIDYNLAENRVLSSMLNEYERGIAAIQIRLNSNQWFGPGQCSSKWLATTDAPKNADLPKLGEGLLMAARASYYGGRFELFQHGHIPGDVYEYDINSAYPDAMRFLPNIMNGRWELKNFSGVGRQSLLKLEPGQIALCYGRFGYASHQSHHYHILGGLPHRTEQGRIFYPSLSMGWYWQAEIQAAELAGCVDYIRLKHAWIFTPADIHERPLAGVAELYLERLRIGKDTPEGKALKLVYNSAYGKLAQSVGQPKYANPFYASLITSHCRTKILEAIATHPYGPDSLVMIATDGVYFRESHPGLVVSPQLGDWDYQTKHNLTTFLPGIYWDDKTRASIRAGQKITVKSRGISGADLARRIAELDELFTALRDTRAISWPRLDVPIQFTYLSLRQALIGRNDDGTSKWNLAGVPVRGAFKNINSSPHTKRNMVLADFDCDAIRYGCKEFDGESTPYQKSFGLFDDEDSLIGSEVASEDTNNLGAELSDLLRNGL